MRPFASAMVVLSLLSLAGLALGPSAPAGQGSGGGAAAAATPPATTGPKPPQDVEVLDTTPSALVATLDRPTTPRTWTVRGTAFLANRAEVDRNLSLTCVLRTASGAVQPCFATPAAVQIVKSTLTNAQPFSITLGDHSLDDFPMNGYVAIAFTDTEGTRGAVKPFAISIKPGTSTGQDYELFRGAFLWALGVVLAATVIICIVCKSLYILFHRMGSPTWSFTSSWSSTITIGAAVVTSFVGFVGLPEYGHTLSKSGYAIGSLIAAGLVGLAPGVYNLFRKPVKGGTTPETVQYQGLVIMFLVAAIFTITGALAQLELLRLMMGDLAMAGLLSAPTGGALGWLWRGVQGATIVYAAFSLMQAVKSQKGDSKNEKVFKDALKPAPPQPLEHWTLL